MSRRHQLLAGCAVLCVILLAATWFLAAKPRKAHVADLKTQTETQLAANRQLQVKITMLRDVERRLPAQQQRAQQLSAKIPADPALAPLLRQLSVAADKAGVKLTGITPSKPAALPVAAGLLGIPVTLTATGAYASLEEYELQLEGLQRAFLVTGFSVSGATGATSASSSSTATELTLSITGQVLTGTPAGAAPAPAATAPATS